MKLTETILSKLPAPEQPKLHADDATPSLYLKVAASGRKTFQYRSRKGGTWDTRTLGTWPDMSLDAARRAVRKLTGSKVDSAMAFGELLDEWYARRIEPRYAVVKNIETYVARGKAALGSKKLTSLTTVELVRELKTYADAAPVAANRCLSNWKLALDYAVECGYLEVNPLARTSARVVGGEEKTRSRVLTDDEIRQVWAWRGHNASLLRFLLLTGLRISEGQHGRQDGTLWRLDTSKNGKPHWVHLPALALAQIDDWSVSETAVQSWVKRQCAATGMAPFTPHDLRRTFATRLAEIGVEPHVVEKCLNHSMQGVMATYNRFEYPEQRIAAAIKLSDEVIKIIEPVVIHPQ